MKTRNRILAFVLFSIAVALGSCYIAGCAEFTPANMRDAMGAIRDGTRLYREIQHPPIGYDQLGNPIYRP